MGGVVLPLGMAFDADNLLNILQLQPPYAVLRFDPQTRRFKPLPGVGGAGSDARQFCRPGNITFAGGDLYVADTGNERVQVFAPGSLGLRRVFARHDWQPADVATHDGKAYILDAQYGHVYRNRPGSTRLARVLERPASSGAHWTRLAIGREGRFYLLDVDAGSVDIYDADGQPAGSAKDASDIRERFDTPAIVLEYSGSGEDARLGRFSLSPDLQRPCNRLIATTAPLVATAPETRGTGLLFRSDGTPSERRPYELPGPALYQQQGDWCSAPLDSFIHRCQWHRIELEVSVLPPGSRLTVSSCASDDLVPTPPSDSPLWQSDYEVLGELQPPVRSGMTDRLTSQPKHEFLVQSRSGRYLYLKIELQSEGFETPVIGSLRAHYPRQSYLSYLPAIYSSDAEAQWFLERLLSVVQTEWDDIEQRVRQFSGRFDPGNPYSDKAWLEYLASLVALPLEEGWTAKQESHLLMGVRNFYTRRGTPEGLRQYLRTYLWNICGLPPEQQRDFPLLVEGFRERERMLSRDGSALDGEGVRRWDDSLVGRLRLGIYSTTGKARLVSLGTHAQDKFQHFAHYFKVFVPAAWVRTTSDEQMLRRALDAEKPAHTAYQLCLVKPRLRVGVQCTVGIDTIMGAVPKARIACAEDEKNSFEADRPPHSRIGYDTVLGGPQGAKQPARIIRVGIETVLN
jgi:phage tail-like protein